MIKVYLDTAPVIYLIDSEGPFLVKAKGVFRELESLGATFCASILLKIEFLSKPFKGVSNNLVFNNFSKVVNLQLYPLQESIVESAITVMSVHPYLKLPDAVHLATAQAAGCTHFFTNDKRLPSLQGMEMVWVE